MQLIAMHGWAGDAEGWAPFHSTWEAQGWHWQCGDRGYGPRPPQAVAWRPGGGPRVVIAHSLGPHLLPVAVLEQADAVVLLASFGRFVAPGAGGRRLQAAINAMAAQLAGDGAETMLRSFLARAAAPQSAELLPPGLTTAPLGPKGREQLGHDLHLLGRSAGLPEGFPSQAKVLLVEGGADQIVSPEARHLLRQALPSADTLTLAGVGHCLLSPALVPLVCGWIGALA